jgi:hypothetical protein
MQRRKFGDPKHVIVSNVASEGLPARIRSAGSRCLCDARRGQHGHAVRQYADANRQYADANRQYADPNR